MIRNLSLVLTLAATLLATSALRAQDDNYDLSIGDADGPVGGTADVSIGLNNELGDDIQGYQWGVCHDDLVTLSDVVNGDSIEDVSFTFQAVSMFDEGWTVGALLDVILQEVLAPGDFPEMFVATYDLVSEGTANVEWCETLGDPLVTVRVVVGGDEIEPAQANGEITITSDPPFIYSATDAEAGYNPSDGLATFTSTMSILEDVNAPANTFPADTQGFQLGLAHDGDLLDVTDALPVGELADLNDGDGPSFLGTNFDPDNGPGLTVGVVYFLMGGVFIQFDEEKDVLDISYAAVGLAGNEDGVTTALTWVNDLGDPVLPNSVVVNGQSFGAALNDATVTLTPSVETLFIRGDANVDGVVNIADPITILSAKVVGGATLDCEAAGDGNNDGIANMADAVFLLQYRFMSGFEPDAPFPLCGIEEGADCAEFALCP